MSKHIRVKLTCEVEDEHIANYIYGQDVYEFNDQFGIVDAEIQEVIVE